MARSALVGIAARPIRALAASDAAAGVLLIMVAVVAVALANSPLAHAWHALFHDPLPWTPLAKLDTLHRWINDAAMALFFFVVGLEVKRELVSGALADPRSRRLPVLAAVAGMATPALVYLAVAGGDPQLAQGWAIPAATDIAFAVGVIGLLGKRVPAQLRLFLLTVAIVDDIGAVAVIALFYTGGVRLEWLLAALLVLAGMLALNRMRVGSAWPFGVAAVALWVCVLHSGVHATIAGVLAALTVPAAPRQGRSMLAAMEHGLARWTTWLVVPLFGLANAGVALGGQAALLAPLPLAIGAGLVLGKQTGIFAAVWLADRAGLARKPAGASWAHIWGVALLCGIGFTMSLFIAALAFPRHPMLVEQAKLGILAGSLVSALAGYAVLRVAGRRGG